MGNATSTQLAEAASLLKHVDLAEDDAALTDFFLKLFPHTPVPAQDVFATFQPDDVRLLRAHRPRNLALVIQEVGESDIGMAASWISDNICTSH